MTPSRRRSGASASGGVMLPCPGFMGISFGRFGDARRISSPLPLQISHPSLGVAMLLNGSTLRAHASLGGPARGAAGWWGSGAGGGGSGRSRKGDDEDAVSKLIVILGECAQKLARDVTRWADSRVGRHEEDPTEKLVKLGVCLRQWALGGAIGFVYGYTTIKVGKAVAFFVGVGLAVAQGLNYAGVVSIRWDKIESKANRHKKDAEALWEKIRTAVVKNVPLESGLVSGFALGFWFG